MEIFKSLSEIEDAKVTTSVVSENVYPEINGELVIKKGILSISINYWGRVAKMSILKDYVTAEDFDFETNNTTINVTSAGESKLQVRIYANSAAGLEFGYALTAEL